MNADFLYHRIKAGLDYAIVNTERLERYASIPEEERRLAEDLIYWRGRTRSRPSPRISAAGRRRPRRLRRCLSTSDWGATSWRARGRVSSRTWP